MFMKYIKSVSGQDCPVVLSITELPGTSSGEPIIQRNNVNDRPDAEPTRIYDRARVIFYRARSQRPVRAVSIF